MRLQEAVKNLRYKLAEKRMLYIREERGKTVEYKVITLRGFYAAVDVDDGDKNKLIRFVKPDEFTRSYPNCGVKNGW